MSGSLRLSGSLSVSEWVEKKGMRDFSDDCLAYLLGDALQAGGYIMDPQTAYSLDHGSGTKAPISFLVDPEATVRNMWSDVCIHTVERLQPLFQYLKSDTFSSVTASMNKMGGEYLVIVCVIIKRNVLRRKDPINITTKK